MKRRVVSCLAWVGRATTIFALWPTGSAVAQGRRNGGGLSLTEIAVTFQDPTLGLQDVITITVERLSHPNPDALLTVSVHPGVANGRNSALSDDVSLTIGAAGPQSPIGPQGPERPQGTGGDNVRVASFLQPGTWNRFLLLLGLQVFWKLFVQWLDAELRCLLPERRRQRGASRSRRLHLPGRD